MRRGPRRWTAPTVIAMACALMWPVASGATPTHVQPGPDEPLRLLIIGDSVTQGSSGDWTWRYRLWQHLRATSSRSVDLVGPRDDLHDYLTDESGNHDYVDDKFDRDHAARWGMTLAFADTPIDELVATYEPDVVVELLGTNDLLLSHSPDRVEEDIENFVAAARSADPNVDVVLSEITQTWFSGGPELNARLADGAAALDSPDARVVLADTDLGYTDPEHTFDGSHPNAQGEVLIAAAVADALAELGIGAPADRPLPTVPLGPRIPPVLSATAEVHAAELEWVRSPGSPESEVWQRDVTAGEDWQLVAEHVTGLGASVTDLPPWHVVQFRTRPFKGRLGAAPDALSNVVEVEVLDDALEAAEAPSVRPLSGGGTEVSWPAVPHATSYVVQWRSTGTPGGWQSRTVEGSLSTVVSQLPSRRSYTFRVRGVHGEVIGPFSSETTLRVPAWSGDPANVLLLGDSVTMGSTGDWTWRYRLWKHLESAAPGQVDLVGPRTDLYDRATGTSGHQEYVDPAFDRDHAAGWGTGATFPPHPVHELVVSHQVDTVVEMLGFNDLDLLPLTPAEVADEVRSLVMEARMSNPEVDIVLGEVPQTWVSGAPELNLLLHALAVELDTGEARVVVAETADGFFRRADTYDDSHPNARGELKIAAAVADALAQTGLGAAAVRPLEVVPLGPRSPVVLRGRPRDGKVKLRWTSSPGADGYRVLMRLPATGKSWKKVGETARRRLTIRGLTPGRRVEFVVLPRKGRALAELDVRSNRLSLRP